MKTIHVQDAIGTMLRHDITRIVPNGEKGPAFHKGHIVTQEDISTLLDIGKEHLYVFDPKDGYVHENDAAERIASAAMGQGLKDGAPSEGKVNITAAHTGLLDINVEALTKLNSVQDVIFGTIHTMQLVKKGRGLAGTRVIPLVVPEDIVTEAEEILRDNAPLIQVRPLKKCKVGVIITGSEIYKGRIEDKFGPVIHTKFSSYGSTILGQKLVSDSQELTVNAINEFVEQGADFIVLTGGMSVDPDDQTPASIRASGADVITYGAPMFPGAMFMYAQLGDIPILGLPGCVMYYKASVFDVIVPRILAGVSVTAEDIVALGHGGYCEGCAECRYPVCGFGK